jgi:hypothetical protein
MLGDEMSKINGDKARHNLRDRKQAKMRVKNKALRATLEEDLKTTSRPHGASPTGLAPAK